MIRLESVFGELPRSRAAVTGSVIAAIAPAVALALAAVGNADGSASWPGVGLVLGVAALRWNGGLVPLLVWGAVGAIWVVTAPQPQWLALPAAAALLLGHAALAWLAGAPRDVRPSPALLARWSARLLVVGAVTGLTYAVGTAARGAHWPGSVLLTCLVLLGLAGWLWLSGRPADAPGDP